MERIDAIGRAGSTAGRAVVFNGMTLILALIGMLLIPFNIFISIGLGAIFVVFAAIIAAMTLLPSLVILFDRLSAWYGRMADEQGMRKQIVLVLSFVAFFIPFIISMVWRLISRRSLGDINFLRWMSEVGIGRFDTTPTYNTRTGFWDRWVRIVMAKPIINLIINGGLLIAAIIPFFNISTGFAGISTYPDELESKQAFLVMERNFLSVKSRLPRS